MEKLRREPVIVTISETGERLASGVNELIDRHGCGSFLSLKGHPTWSSLVFGEANGTSVYDIKTLWMQEILARGVLSVGTHNLSYAHSAEDVDRLLDVYDEVFPILRAAIEQKRVRQYLRCKPLGPLFNVR